MSLSLNRNEIAFLKALNNNQVRYLIVGLSSAILQNASVVTQDVDLWIEELGSKPFNQAVTEVGGFYIPPGVAGPNPPMLGPDTLKIFDIVTHMHGLENFSEEFNRSIEAEIEEITVRLLPLDRIIVSKEAINREKDKAVLPALKAALAIKNKAK